MARWASRMSLVASGVKSRVEAPTVAVHRSRQSELEMTETAAMWDPRGVRKRDPSAGQRGCELNGLLYLRHRSSDNGELPESNLAGTAVFHFETYEVYPARQFLNRYPDNIFRRKGRARDPAYLVAEGIQDTYFHRPNPRAQRIGNPDIVPAGRVRKAIERTPCQTAGKGRDGRQVGIAHDRCV